jgi:hypothetical protein
VGAIALMLLIYTLYYHIQFSKGDHTTNNDRRKNMGEPTITECFCQVLAHKEQKILIYFGWFMDDDNEAIWMPKPPGMPSWCLESSIVFECQMPTGSTLEQIREAPWKLMGFRIHQNPVEKGMEDRLPDNLWKIHMEEKLGLEEKVEAIAHNNQD